jgi:hypothetical protein
MRLIAVEETTQHIDGWNIAFESEGDALSAARARRRHKHCHGGVSGPDGPVMQTTYHAEE